MKFSLRVSLKMILKKKLKVAPYSNSFNGGLDACVNSDLVVSKFYDRVNINIRILDVFFDEFR